MADAIGCEFPLLCPPKGFRRALPWPMLEPHEPQALRNHGQSLQRLAERGGLGVIEALAVLRDCSYRAVMQLTEVEAALALGLLVAEFERLKK